MREWEHDHIDEREDDHIELKSEYCETICKFVKSSHTSQKCCRGTAPQDMTAE